MTIMVMFVGCTTAPSQKSQVVNLAANTSSDASKMHCVVVENHTAKIVYANGIEIGANTVGTVKTDREYILVDAEMLIQYTGCIHDKNKPLIGLVRRFKNVDQTNRVVVEPGDF